MPDYESVEVDPDRLWKTAHSYMPSVAGDFIEAARCMDAVSEHLGNAFTMGVFDSDAGVDPGAGFSKFNPNESCEYAQQWQELKNLVQDIVNTTGVNLDATAGALAEICTEYVSVDSAAANDLNAFLRENHPGHKADEDPDRITDDYDLETGLDDITGS